MKVILSVDVKALGKKGEVVEVSEGYARNYLLPRKLAVEASQGNLKVLSEEKAWAQKKKDKELAEAKVLAKKLEQVTVTVHAKSGEGGRLFGSVTNKEIGESLARDFGLQVDKRKIELKEAIKALGMYPVQVRVHPAVVAELKVHVISQ